MSPWQHWHWIILQVHAMSWMPDLMFSPLLSWLKHSENSSSKDFSMTFWIQRSEMHSVCYLSLRDALLSSALSNSSLFLYETVWHKNYLYCQVLSSSMKALILSLFFFGNSKHFKKTTYNMKINSWSLHWKLNHSGTLLISIGVTWCRY